MKTLKTASPKALGYTMPGEYEPHRGTVLIWPVRPGSWPYGGGEAKRKFCEIAGILSKRERVWMLADKEHVREAKELLLETVGEQERIQVVEIPTDDAWARDTGPTCIRNGEGRVLGLDWKFNAWGGDYDGLFQDWEEDNRAARRICSALGIEALDCQDLVLEGGSIACDGEGTLVVTSCCLLSPGRNPSLSKEEIEERLKERLGVEKVIWLPYGIVNDETNGHVDNIFAFTSPGEGVLAWCDNPQDPQYELSRADLRVLKEERDAKGRSIKVKLLPIPSKPICVQKEDIEGLHFAPGEDMREVGERLAASYVNFYIGNGAVLVPQFGDPNDVLAVELLMSLFPQREIYPIQSRCILVGGGNLHCITQQIPMGRELDRKGYEEKERREEKTLENKEIEDRARAQGKGE